MVIIMICQKELPHFATLFSKVPSWFEEFVFKCCEKDRNKRFLSAKEALTFLESNSLKTKNLDFIPNCHDDLTLTSIA